ncbi:hypothetical protein [Isoptericola sp. NPDC019482]|uniref:hypothetical protein n=1 Tax=Isoptericola sp. NPDC019482 TaxID=3154688 RepID=UPI003487786E
MKRYRARKWLSTRLDRAAGRLDPEHTKGWHKRSTQRHPSWEATQPRKFADIDKLVAFAAEVHYVGGARQVLFDNETGLGHRLAPGEDSIDAHPLDRALAEHLATAVQYHRYFEIVGHGPQVPEQRRPDVVWTITMNSRPEAAAPTVITWRGHERDDGATFTSLSEKLERHTVPISRRQWRKGANLIEPMPALDAVHAERENAIARRARWWGLAGAAAGVVSGVAASLLTSNA